MKKQLYALIVLCIISGSICAMEAPHSSTSEERVNAERDSRNVFKDAIEASIKQDDIDIESLKELKKTHPDDFREFLDEHKRITVILFSLVPEEVLSDAEKAFKMSCKGIINTLTGKNNKRE